MKHTHTFPHTSPRDLLRFSFPQVCMQPLSLPFPQQQQQQQQSTLGIPGGVRPAYPPQLAPPSQPVHTPTPGTTIPSTTSASAISASSYRSQAGPYVVRPYQPSPTLEAANGQYATPEMYSDRLGFYRVYAGEDRGGGAGADYRDTNSDRFDGRRGLDIGQADVTSLAHAFGLASLQVHHHVLLLGGMDRNRSTQGRTLAVQSTPCSGLYRCCWILVAYAVVMGLLTSVVYVYAVTLAVLSHSRP